jgi:phosphomannomutase
MSIIKIKFGTDGWRAIIADEFTVDNVKRVAEATAQWLLSEHEKPAVVVGNDCRFAGPLFSVTVARVMAFHNIKVYLADNEFVSTPMISLAAVNLKAQQGIIITASHNPASYNGYKLKGAYGGPTTPKDIEKVESLIPEKADQDLKTLEEYKAQGLVELIDLEDMYCRHAESSFDLEAIRDSNMSFAYDAMFGAGQNVMKRLLPDVSRLHCEHNPGFEGQAPEPIHKNLQEFSELIKVSGDIASGLATDGDADRIGLYDDKGNFVDSHHIILLLIHYLHKIKGLGGKVIYTFSCTQKIKKLCEAYGLEYDQKKIGFKYICEDMITQDVLVGGEESGGIAIKGHIPERDGIWVGLTLWENMVKTGKSLNDLIQEVYDIVGSFAVERSDLHLLESKKQNIISICKAGAYKSFGNLNIERVEDLDGFKFHLGNEEWVMIRPSGTEPVLRVYAEAATSKRAFEILKATEEEIMKG